MRRLERGLFDLGEIILRIAVQLDGADLDQRIILVRPDFGQVEGDIGRLVGIGLGHDLHAAPPFRVGAALDRLEQVALVAFAVVADNPCRLGVRQGGDTLQMELYPAPLIGGVDKL